MHRHNHQRDPWDISSPTLENLETKYIQSPPTFVTIVISLGSTCNFRGTEALKLS